MAKPDQGGDNDKLYDLAKTVQLGRGVVDVMASPHRVVHCKIGSMGTRAVDRFTAIGVVLGFPLFLARWPPETPAQHRHAYYAWLALMALAFVHSSAAFWNPRPRHSREVGRPRFGAAEIPVALLVAWVAAYQCGPGAGFYLLAACAANLVQLAMIRARFRRMADLRRDAQLEAAEFRSYVD